MAWNHSTQFRHYITKYPQNGEAFDKVDIEEFFKCRYVSLSNAIQTSVKNTYTESFAEHDGTRVWTPSYTDLAYNTSEMTLCLRWRSDECGDVQEWSDKFFQYVTGQKIQYNDTFRPNKYWQLLMTNAPTIMAEKLFGDLQYRFVNFKFTNWGGRCFSSSQI